MHLALSGSLPGLMEIEYSDNHEELLALQAFYNHLQIKDETIVLSPSNLEAIHTFFNKEKNNIMLSQEMLKINGLTDYAKADDLFITGYLSNSSGLLYKLQTVHHIDIHNVDLAAFIDKSKKQLFAAIKAMDKQKTMSIYSMRDAQYIEIVEMKSYRTSPEKVNVRLKASYMLDKKSFSHFNNVEDGMFFKANINNNGEMRINIEKTYTFDANKD